MSEYPCVDLQSKPFAENGLRLGACPYTAAHAAHILAWLAGVDAARRRLMFHRILKRRCACGCGLGHISYNPRNTIRCWFCGDVVEISPC